MTLWLGSGSKFFLSLTDTVSLVLLTVLVVLLTLLWYTRRERKNLNFPPGPYGVPFFGYLPFFGKEPFKTLNDISKKYGKVFSLNFGKTPVVIINDYEIFREAYSKTELLDRPHGIFDFMPGGGGGFAATNGRNWLEQRRFTMKNVRNLGVGKGPWEVAIAEEVENFVKSLRKYGSQPIAICQPLRSSLSRIILSLLLARPIEENTPTSKMIIDFLDASMKVIADSVYSFHYPNFINSLRRILGMQKLEKEKKILEEFEKFIRKEIRERREGISPNDSSDFIGSYLEEMQNKEDMDDKNSTYDVPNLIGNITGMILGGSDTTTTSMQWLFVAMVQYPDIQEKIYMELENVLGEKKIANWEDRSKLPWTYASITECQRWKTLAPLGVLREVNEDCQIYGFDIPKGTAIMGHLWAFHNDSRYWKNPEMFDPSRFLKEETLNRKKDGYAPFSLGRRNCPGETIALMELFIYFSTVVRNFKILAGNPEKKFEVKGITGQTYEPESHKLRFVPRK